MRSLPSLLALPPAVLVGLLTPAAAVNVTSDAGRLAVQDSQWPYNLPPHIKYWPNDVPHQRRDLDFLQRRMAEGGIPSVVKKMSADDKEMFFHEYWSFAALGEDGAQEPDLSGRDVRDTAAGQGNVRKSLEAGNQSLVQDTSAQIAFRPAFRLHIEDSTRDAYRELGRRKQGTPKRSPSVPDIFKRGECPGGTVACATNGYCCATGETCITIADTGLGPVGCCSTGSTCSGTITSCAAGQTACPQRLGGACCIAGFQCAGTGCVQTVIVTITSVFTVSDTPTSTIVISTIVSSAISPTDTSLQTTLACASGARPCPINLGGGCCNSDRICTTGLLCPLSPGLASTTDVTTIVATNTLTATVTGSSSAPATSTDTPNAPVRPTTSVATTALQTTTTALTPGTCPTGFYQCSAYYNAGACCRVGRDCQTTDCSSTASTTLVSDGVTIVVPLTGAATSFATGSCATGWSTCGGTGATAGGCCPSGYACGSESCSSAAASSTGVVSKQGVGSGARRMGGSGTRWVAGVVAAAAVVISGC